MNPYRTLLLWVGVIGVAGGVILVLVGMNSVASYYGPDLSAMIPWGTAIAGTGTLAILLWLVVAALTWSPTEGGVTLRELGDAFRKGLNERGQ